MGWIDLSNMGHLITSDRDHLDLIHRISTNNLNKLAVGEGCATIFTSPIARIIDRVVVLNRGETAFVITSFGRGTLIENLLKQNVFWNDRFQVENLSNTVRQIGVFGEEWWPEAVHLHDYQFVEDHDALIVRIPKPNGFWVIGNPDYIDELTVQLSEKGIPQLSQTDYEVLRIEAGLPEADHELTEDYIPLEIGLWDAVSFNKGCYTGQEIIARMESRGKLAKMMVQVEMETLLSVGTDLLDLEGKTVGRLTSAVSRKNAKPIGLAVIKTVAAQIGQILMDTQETPVIVTALAGTYEPNYS